MKKALVIQAARFGDLVQTGRLIKSLLVSRETHLAIDNSFKSLAEALFPGAFIHCFPFHQPISPDTMPALMESFEKLAAIDFEQIFNCNFSPLSANLSRLFPEDKIIGLRPGHSSSGDILRSQWVRLAFRLAGRRKITSLNLEDYWGWFTIPPLLPELVNPPAAPGGDGVGVVLAGREARRSLPPPILAKIVNVVATILKSDVIYLFGTEREKSAATSLKRLLPPEARNKVQDLCGKTGWAELIAKLRKLDLLLTPDTGTMHLAAFLGAPVMAFFLSSAWCHETAPYGKGHLIWQASATCSPCLETATCAKSVECLNFFQDDAFLRLVAGALTNNARILSSLPQGLQLWRTEFDSAGQILKLEGGRDGQDAERLIARKLIDAFLLRKSANLTEFDREKVIEITEYLFPEAEWMLPSKRYC